MVCRSQSFGGVVRQFGGADLFNRLPVGINLWRRILLSLRAWRWAFFLFSALKLGHISGFWLGYFFGAVLLGRLFLRICWAILFWSGLGCLPWSTVCNTANPVAPILDLRGAGLVIGGS